MSQSIDADHYWKHGYTIVRGALERAEVEAWRAQALEHAGHVGDILSHPTLWPVISHPAILESVSTILKGTPVYFGDSAPKIGVLGRGYHKDNADRFDGDAPDWRDPYTLLRVGVYLQDHTRLSGGLNVRHGSHMKVSLKAGRTVYIDTGLGDMVIWSLRTSHSANGVLLRGLKGLHISPRWVRWTPSFLVEGTAEERVALFMTFALDDAHLERYLAYAKTRAYMIDLWKASAWSEQARSACAGAPMVLRNVWGEIEGEEGIGLQRDYAAIPY